MLSNTSAIPFVTGMNHQRADRGGRRRLRRLKRRSSHTYIRTHARTHTILYILERPEPSNIPCSSHFSFRLSLSTPVDPSLSSLTAARSQGVGRGRDNQFGWPAVVVESRSNSSTHIRSGAMLRVGEPRYAWDARIKAALLDSVHVELKLI